jgi:hypothetical protein
MKQAELNHKVGNRSALARCRHRVQCSKMMISDDKIERPCELISEQEEEPMKGKTSRIRSTSQESIFPLESNKITTKPWGSTLSLSFDYWK